MTKNERYDALEAYSLMAEAHLRMFQMAMKNTSGNIGLSLQIAASFTSAISHDATSQEGMQWLIRWEDNNGNNN